MHNTQPPDFGTGIQGLPNSVKICIDPHSLLSERISVVARAAERLRTSLSFIDEEYVRREPEQAMKIRIKLIQAKSQYGKEMKDPHYTLEGTPLHIALDIHNYTIEISIEIYDDDIRRIDRILGE